MAAHFLQEVNFYFFFLVGEGEGGDKSITEDLVGKLVKKSLAPTYISNCGNTAEVKILHHKPEVTTTWLAKVL